ncbi:hemolysin family protein [bacterium]|nr:hemolysin family protein [bacterium]
MISVIGIVVAVTLITSFFCSLAEAALLSTPMGRIESLRRAGKPVGALLMRMKLDPDRPISAILILNTLSHTVGATVAGALVQSVANSTGVALFSAVFTLAILLLSEVLPKTIGVVHANLISPLIARPIWVLIVVLWPLVKICELTVRFVRPSARSAFTHSEEDILSEARLAAGSGAILHEEVEWMANMLKLNDLTVKEIMTPRPVVFYVEEDITLREVMKRVPQWNYSRIPVARENDLDHAVGVVMTRKILEEIAQDHFDKRVGDLMQDVDFVPESMRAHVLLKEFVTRKTHMFLVVDEYGGTEGVVTLEDVIEVMIGTQIVDETDRYTNLREVAKQRAQAFMRQLKKAP